MTQASGSNESDDRREFWERLRKRHPGFRHAVLADTRVVSANRGRPLANVSDAQVTLEALRLIWTSDSFGAQILYRARAALVRRGVPILPTLLHKLTMWIWGICIGAPVLIQPGVHLAHGQIVIDGMVEIGSGARIFPFVTIGLRAGQLRGPTLKANVLVGSGARVLGPVNVGQGARIGANAVVVDDVAPRATVVGAPARPIP